MIALVRAELLKLCSTRTALGMAVTTLVLSLGPAILLAIEVPASDLTMDTAVSAASLVPYVLLVFGILGMTNEYRHGTITYTYLVAPRRWRVMAVKLLVYAVVGLLIMLIVLALVCLVVLVGGAARGVAVDPPGGADFVDYARQILVAGLITAFGVSLGALLRAQVPTVAGVLIWALAIENIIAMLKPKIGSWLPFIVFSQVTGGRLGGGESDYGLTRPEAFLVSIVYIAAVSVAAVYISMRRDVT